MVWDCTCPDTLAASHLDRAVLSASAVANDAETRKSSKYRSLIGVNVLFRACSSRDAIGALGEEASAFFCDLGHRIAAVTSEPI